MNYNASKRNQKETVQILELKNILLGYKRSNKLLKLIYVPKSAYLVALNPFKILSYFA